MSNSNVHKDGMNIDRMLAQLTDREVDKLLDGRHPVHGHGIEALAAAIETLRSTQGGARPRVGAELEAVFSHGLAVDGSAPPEWAIPPGPRSGVRTGSWRARLKTRTTRALMGLSVPLDTLAGKLMIVTAVAAAGISGLQAAGVVGAPGLPDRPLVIDQVRDQDRTPASDDAEQAGDAGRQQPDTGDVDDEHRGGGVDGGDQSEPATGGVPPSSGAPVDQNSAGTGQSAQTQTEAPGQSPTAETPTEAEQPKDDQRKSGQGKAAKKANNAAKRPERRATKMARDGPRNVPMEVP